MRRSTTSVGTERPVLGLVLLAELILACLLLGRANPAVPPNPPTARDASAPATAPTPTAASTTETLRDGRTVELVGLGGQRTATLLRRIAAQMDDAAQAVTAFWGPDWPRDIVIVASGSNAQFDSLAGGGADTAATTTAERITFAPGAAAMSDAALRIVLRHELFHYAARASTAADAPRWLTEGVADFVARPRTPPPDAAALTGSASWGLPTDADLDATGATRSQAYDRAWWFSRFVAAEYGEGTLRELYLRACGPGHADAATAVQATLGGDLESVLTRWHQWLTRLA